MCYCNKHYIQSSSPFPFLSTSMCHSKPRILCCFHPARWARRGPVSSSVGVREPRHYQSWSAGETVLLPLFRAFCNKNSSGQKNHSLETRLLFDQDGGARGQLSYGSCWEIPRKLTLDKELFKGTNSRISLLS